jgi:ATP-dependent Clp protease adaptor protein ClpS
MNDITTAPTIKDEIKAESLRLHKVILINDDFTPREFVVMVLKAEFRMSEDQARDDHCASARLWRRCRLHEGCSGSQGNERDGCGPTQGLSPVVHDRARGIGGGSRETCVRWPAAPAPARRAGGGTVREGA